MTSKSRLAQWALVAVLLMAAGLRLYRLSAQSLWYDETVSVHLAGESIPALIAHTAGDIHPPGYYVLLHAWVKLAGTSDFAAAYLSVWFGVLLVALAYRLGARVFGQTAGLLAALLVATSPYNLWYSQEVRMYTLGATLGMGVLLATLSLLRAPMGTVPSWRRLAVYVVCGALGLWVLYYFAFLLVALNLMVCVWWLVNRRRGRVGWAWLGRWAVAQCAIALAYVPWLPVAWRQATSPPVPPWRGFIPLGTVVVETWSALTLGQSVRPQQVWPALVWAAVVFFPGLLLWEAWHGRRSSSRRGGDLKSGRSVPWILAGFVFLPVLLIYLTSFITPLYHVRYAFTYSTPFYVVLGAGLAWLWRRSRPVWALGLGLLLAYSAVSVRAYYTDPQYASDDHRQAAAFLSRNWRPGDAILIDAGYVYTALLHYWNGDPIVWRGRLLDDPRLGDSQAMPEGPIVLQAGSVDGEPSLGWGSPQSDFYAMSPDETASSLARVFFDFDRLWLYRCYDTVTDPDGLIRTWLDEHGAEFEDQVFTGDAQLRVQGFLTGRDPLVGSGEEVDQRLADGSLQLAKQNLAQKAVNVGSTLDLGLIWRVGVMPADGRILFAGLFDEDGRRWAQTDERPLGSLLPVADWPEGAVVGTPLRLAVPVGTLPGRYRLELGWYRFVDGQPVWLPWTEGDRLVLGHVDVTAPEEWWALAQPIVDETLGVNIGKGLRLLGVSADSLAKQPGEEIEIELWWQALHDQPEPGLAVLQLVDDEGRVLAEMQAAPGGGRLPFMQLTAGQVARDPRSLLVPEGILPGVYDVVVGRRRADGTWLPVRCGPLRLGDSWPLVTVRVLEPRVE